MKLPPDSQSWVCRGFGPPILRGSNDRNLPGHAILVSTVLRRKRLKEFRIEPMLQLPG
jgi:hypothetical protein